MTDRERALLLLQLISKQLGLAREVIADSGYCIWVLDSLQDRLSQLKRLLATGKFQ